MCEGEARALAPDCTRADTRAPDPTCAGLDLHEDVRRSGCAERHHITGFEVVISGAAASADIFVEIKTGTRRIWRTCIGSGAVRGERTGLSFAHPIPGSPGEDITVYVDAGGAGCVTTANLEGFTR